MADNDLEINKHKTGRLLSKDDPQLAEMAEQLAFNQFELNKFSGYLLADCKKKGEAFLSGLPVHDFKSGPSKTLAVLKYWIEAGPHGRFGGQLMFVLRKYMERNDVIDPFHSYLDGTSQHSSSGNANQQNTALTLMPDQIPAVALRTVADLITDKQETVRLATNLGFSMPELAKLSASSEPVEAIAWSVLLKWQQRSTRTATPDALREVLINIERSDLADRFKESVEALQEAGHQPAPEEPSTLQKSSSDESIQQPEEEEAGTAAENALPSNIRQRKQADYVDAGSSGQTIQRRLNLEFKDKLLIGFVFGPLVVFSVGFFILLAYVIWFS